MNEKNSTIAKASHPAWGVKSQGLNSKGLAVEEVSGGTCGLFRYNAKNLTLLCIDPNFLSNKYHKLDKYKGWMPRY